ncbi:MAG TPA: hypothetical protein VLA31_10555, partial [Burkholderiaceae bacterium]|nr:hypothetical protein [Burkholderiaceae bacterium]
MTAAGVGQLAGVTGAAYPAMYIQEYHDLKELGMEDDWKLRALAGGTALVGSAIEGIVPDILPGRVRLNQGVANAARQYLWEAAKKMPGELSEEGLQELTSGLGKHIASYIDENVEDRQLSKTFQDSWKAMEESALPMAFLMGIPAVGTAGLATPIAMRETSQFRDMAANLTPEQSAQAIARLNELQQIKNMKFIPEDVAREAGIPGATRKERMDNLNEEMFQLKSLADLATRTGRTRPAEGFQGDSTTVPGMSPPTEGVFNEVRQQGQQVEQGPQQVEGDRQVLQEELRPQEEVDQIAFDAISEPGRQAAIAAQQEVAPPEATNQEEAAPDP